MKRSDLTLPIIVWKAPSDDMYVIANGTHTAYYFWESGATKIRAQLDINPSPMTNAAKFYRFDELIVEP